MKALLIYPLFPTSFWSFEKVVELIGRKTFIPPLGLITVAAILPREWDLKLVDRNVRNVTEAEWDWAEIVILSGMIVQKGDILGQIREAKQRGKKVAIGGPYATSFSQDLKGKADYLVLDEGEITIPMFVEAIAKGEESGIFRAMGKPDVTQTPIPRYDLLDLNAYSEISIQFSRGCPFQCEFCDIIVLYGRKPRTKTPQQLIAELQSLYDLGWRGPIFMVDDNFIGNKRNVKLLLKELQLWLEKQGFPFTFATEASVDLAKDQELMDLMTACNFKAVFLGIETPDESSLAVTKKFQNTRDPLEESVHKIISSGLRVMAGFIIGFDGEKTGAGDRIVKFVEKSTIPAAVFSMLQALPETGLWHRLEKEGRLIGGSGDINQTTLMNFIPTRPVTEIAREYVDGFWQLYDPQAYLDRVYRHFRILAEAPCRKKPQKKQKSTNQKIDLHIVKALILICYRQGFLRKTRLSFWVYLWEIYRLNPREVPNYLGVCAHLEHFLAYRQTVKNKIEAQLATYPEQIQSTQAEEASNANKKIAIAS